MNKLKSGLLITLCFTHFLTFAQKMNTTREEPTDFMRSEGKIYVVVAVVVTIVIGIFIYLLNLDRKIKKLERSIKSDSK